MNDADWINMALRGGGYDAALSMAKLIGSQRIRARGLRRKGLPSKKRYRGHRK
jgi:hypothetical protein